MTGLRPILTLRMAICRKSPDGTVANVRITDARVGLCMKRLLQVVVLNLAE